MKGSIDDQCMSISVKSSKRAIAETVCPKEKQSHVVDTRRYPQGTWQRYNQEHFSLSLSLLYLQNGPTTTPINNPRRSGCRGTSLHIHNNHECLFNFTVIGDNTRMQIDDDDYDDDPANGTEDDTHAKNKTGW